ncbi:Methionine aminopeptidase [Candidatus Sulfobium mesophilum]|uniref:Methionine aminopeptidase n=1 Tax=Candidatus Sulfobium mesophilum TaxID=2016548 RepID=A0A2U3QKX3_9BACT|nr:Methionine aminopeptidase [Candidatus Sulfobium mesophilum]
MSMSGRIVAQVIDSLKKMVAIGVTTKEIEDFADERIKALGGIPAFKGYRGYPSSVCISVNEQVVHGIPSDRKLKDGDIVSIDIGVFLDGFYGDAAVTISIGTIDKEAADLIRVTEESLYLGIENAVEGKRLYDISSAIQKHVEENGFSVVRLFVGHGIGRELHEEPQIPNYGVPGQGPRLKRGMTLAIEPMVNAGGHEVIVLEDGWTAVTKDGKRSAHFEHTVLVTQDKPRILTKNN